MFREVKDSNIKITEFFFPLINAVLEGLQEGKVFFENGLYFIIHKSGFSYVIDTEESEYQKLFDFFIHSQLLPSYFHIYDAAPEIIMLSSQNSDKINFKLRKRIQLKFSDERLNLLDKIPHGYSLDKINAENFESISIFNLSLDNKFWKSKEDFLKNGFGFILTNEVCQPVSICYSACIANNTAEVDVATLSNYRKMGFAKLVVGQFVRHCLENRIIASWDCYDDNLGSIKTADNLGFKFIRTYNFLSIFNKARNHEAN